MESGAEITGEYINPKVVDYYRDTKAFTKKLGQYTCLTEIGAWRTLKLMPGTEVSFASVRWGKKALLLQFNLKQPVTVNKYKVLAIEVAIDKYDTLIESVTDLKAGLEKACKSPADGPIAEPAPVAADATHELYGVFS